MLNVVWRNSRVCGITQVGQHGYLQGRTTWWQSIFFLIFLNISNHVFEKHNLIGCSNVSVKLLFYLTKRCVKDTYDLFPKLIYERNTKYLKQHKGTWAVFISASPRGVEVKLLLWCSGHTLVFFFAASSIITVFGLWVASARMATVALRTSLSYSHRWPLLSVSDIVLQSDTQV